MSFHELVEKINTRRRESGYLTSLKIDMSKAYDYVHWDFLLRVLREYGFSGHWIQLINQCVFMVSYKVLLSGNTSEQFRPYRGIRQGDPLGPFFFFSAWIFYQECCNLKVICISLKLLICVGGVPYIAPLFRG